MENNKVAIYNTFRVEAYAAARADVGSVVDAERWANILRRENAPFYIIGGGSNVLFTENFPGVILHPADSSFSIVSEDAHGVTLVAGAGMEWDKLVEYTCSRGWWGLENLSGIPGSVGASPVQNIGAYGSSCSDTLRRVHTFDLARMEETWYSAPELDLAYRWSKFKDAYAGRKIILNVEFTLSKHPTPRTTYGRLPEILNGPDAVTPQSVRNAVLKIRGEKLPPVDEVGSAGSFFKNPELSPKEFARLKSIFPDIPEYDGTGGNIKVPAGWIIERCGWRGKRRGDTQVYPKQALIIVNVGTASGKEIDAFAEEVSNDIYKRCGVRLEREVNMVRPYRLSDL